MKKQISIHPTSLVKYDIIHLRIFLIKPIDNELF